MSTPDPYARAARFFLLAEQASRFKCWWLHTMFWEMSVSLVRDPTVYLPALAAAVSKEYDDDVLRELALHPLPGLLLPEAVPWHDRLVDDWEVHRALGDSWVEKAVRLTLVRLDGCGMPDGMQRPSRLPEWLAEARRMVRAGGWAGSEPARTGPGRSGESPTEKLEALAALANWRPTPRVITPPKTLQKWVAFWLERRRSRDPIMRGIAAMALLNLPEADLRSASLQPVPPEQLLRNLTAAIPAAAERTARKKDCNYLSLLDWQPVEGNTWPAAGVAEVARVWLDVTLHNDWGCRQMAWQQLVRWDRTGILTSCGMDLLPFLVSAAQTEESSPVLLEMARWRAAAEVFTGTEKPDALALLRELETHWQHHRQSSNWMVRASAWLAGIHLHQAGLATEPPERFQEAYLSAVAQEHDGEVLLVLAQWSPGAAAPAALHRKWQQVWQRRLEDDSFRQLAVFALLRQVLENEAGEGLRRAALERWRTGMKEGQAARQMLGTALFRLHEVRAHLSTGGVPDFEEEPVPPAQRQYPHLALPPGHITDRKWRIENEKLKIENHEGSLGPANRPVPDGPSR